MKNIPDQYGRMPSYTDKRRAKARMMLQDKSYAELLNMHIQHFGCLPPPNLSRDVLRLKLVRKLNDLANGV